MNACDKIVVYYKGEVFDMQNILKKAKTSIVFYIIITFLIMSVLGTLSAFIQGMLLVVLILFIIVTFWFNPILVAVMYFTVKKRIDNSSNQDYTSIEWTMIKLDIILAQFAGVVMSFLLTLSLDKDFFMISYGGFGLWSVIIGMGITLVLMFLGVAVKDICLVLKSNSKSKKQEVVVTENNGLTPILLILAGIMCVLILTGFFLGRKLVEPPSLEKLLQDKSEYILEHKDYIETIRQYLEDLDYKEIVSCGEWKQKIGNLSVSYHMDEEGYSTLRLNADEVLRESGLKDIGIVEYSEIVVEFETNDYQIKKIRIPVKYRQTGIKNLVGGGLVWYSFDYQDRLSGLILDDNWQMNELEIAGHPQVSRDGNELGTRW